MDFLLDLANFYDNFKQKKGYIGKTEEGRSIPFFFVKKTQRPRIIVQCAIHAREYVTTYLCYKMIEHFCLTGKKGAIYFVPAVNLDGIVRVFNGDKQLKANARRVDLNVNFDAKWGKGQKNLFYPNNENYVGEYPFSESETRALRDFTIKVKPDITISYHSKGEEIYYQFNQKGHQLERDYKIANQLALTTGYSVKSTPGSVGGYKDWCIEKFGIPAFTIEVGSDLKSHPLKKEMASEIFEKNKDVLSILTEKVKWK